VPVVEATVDVACTPYPTLSCTGQALGGDGVRPAAFRALPPVLAWATVVGGVGAPDGTESLLCTVSATGEYTPFVLEVDDVELRAVDGSATERPSAELSLD
jgi:hypothetical protein